MRENQANSQQLPNETDERPPRLTGRSNVLAAFILAEAVLVSPIALAAGVAAFQLIRNGEISPAMEFWMRLAILGLAGPIILAAIHAEISSG